MLSPRIKQSFSNGTSFAPIPRAYVRYNSLNNNGITTKLRMQPGCVIVHLSAKFQLATVKIAKVLLKNVAFV